MFFPYTKVFAGLQFFYIMNEKPRLIPLRYVLFPPNLIARRIELGNKRVIRVVALLSIANYNESFVRGLNRAESKMMI